MVVNQAKPSIILTASLITTPKAYIKASPIKIFPKAGSTSTVVLTYTLFVKSESLIIKPFVISMRQLISLGKVLIEKALYNLVSPFFGQNTSKAPVNFKLSPFSVIKI